MINEQRKSPTAINKIYFWTATIHKWIPLLDETINKQIIIDSLKYLSDKELITVYGFVIMPNHIHLIWQQNHLNGKETPKGSLFQPLLAYNSPTPIHYQIVPTLSALVSIPITHSHPLPNHSDRHCWFAAEEVAERTDNNKCIPNYKRFSVF